MSRNKPASPPVPPANPPVGEPSENPSPVNPPPADQQPAAPTEAPKIVVPHPTKGPRTEEQKREAMRIRIQAQMEAAAKRYGGMENMMKKIEEDSKKDLSSGRNEREGKRWRGKSQGPK